MAKHDAARARCQDAVWLRIRSAAHDQLKHLIEAVMLQRRREFCHCRPYERSPRRRALRNGFYHRSLDTTMGTIRLRVPRVRPAAGRMGADQCRFDALVLDAYGRRRREVDAAVLDWIACGQSTREVSRSLRACFGCVLSAAGVSRVVAGLDARVRAFHRRPLVAGYRFAYFDAKHWYVSHLRRRRGRGRKKKAVLLLAWGVRHNGAEELIDFRVADAESEAAWTGFLTDLERRGLKRRNPWNLPLEMIVTDGDAGLRSALWMVYPTVPKQLCAFHRVQSLAEHLRDRGHRRALLSTAAALYDGLRSRRQAMMRLRRWAARWADREPEAVRRLQSDFEDTLTYLNAPAAWRRRLKTSNPIERLIRELNRKTNKVGPYPSAKSWERATYLLWQKLQAQGYAPTTRAAPLSTSTQDP
jgi:transposase-like protein